ncbi:hypothetical protein [Wenyingzhuangia aestuarii]|uniref:hypothetical protein n=1 Tax=Wenyingzhuangia aestuarii TaxID=1647582 RepID=UPI00143A473B|nr:hypothetical protein [Wenyingzhuangia aestuarii]NJB82069.1 putative HicB family RNase H-like nuclease [Wenyingzhuangia aestuarii]
MEYKKFKGEYFFSEPDNVFAGQVSNLSDLISFEADEEKGLQKEFELAVDDYIETCKILKKEIVFMDGTKL